MELRGYSHIHYMHAIKGGVMTKVLNINSRGKPAVVFKKLTDIYESIYDKAQESLPTQWAREGLEEIDLDRCESKVETQVLYAERKLFNDEPEVSDPDSKSDTDGQKSDVEVDSMTIKQIMDGCKKRKLRQSKYVDSSKEKLRTCSKRELKHSSLLSDENDSDLDVSLSIWKSKLAKRKKLKTKCDESRISTSSQCSQTIGNSDPINSDQDLLPPSSAIPILADIKVEAPEIDVTEIQNTDYNIDGLSLFCDESVNFCLSSGPIGADELVFSPELTASENEAEYCVLNSACHGYWVGESSGEYMSEDNPEEHKPHCSYLPASESMEGQYAPSFVSGEYMNEDNLEVHKPHCSYLPASESMEGQYAPSFVSKDSMSEAISLSEEQCFISQEGKPFTNEAICLNNGEVSTHLHGMTDLNSLQLLEKSDGAEVCLTENSYKDKLAFDNEKSFPTESASDCDLSPDHGGSISPKSTSDCNLSPDHNLSPDQHLKSIDECPAEKRSQMSDYSNSEGSTSPEFHLNGSVDKFNQFEEPKHHPARLLSTRTTISPTSQERLSKAMKSMQLQDKECKTCGGPYLNQIKYKVRTAECQMKRVNSDTDHVQKIRKSKKRNLHSASNSKVPHAFMRSSTVQNYSNSAIAFTQRQMQDIECLALKLTTQLKSMKAIVEDRLHVEGNIATNFKFNTNEVRTAMTDATKAEARAKKWLSMMSRDCNRFCKIMQTTEHDSNASPPAIEETMRKRKITFADEAGRELCEVKLIEDDVNNVKPFVETSPEKCQAVE